VTTRKNGHGYRSLTNSGIKSNHYSLSLNPKVSLEDLEKMMRMLSGIFISLYWLPMGGFATVFGVPSTAHDRFQDWRKSGLFENMWTDSLLEYDNKN
jgi:hypothetical protein